MENESSMMTAPMKLNLAIKNGDHVEFKRLVEEGHVNPRSEEAKDPSFGASPVYWASKQGQLHILKYLLEEKKCDVMGKNAHGDAPLHGAALGGSVDVMRYLVTRKGCDPMCRGWNGRTPLHCACRNGHLTAAMYLIVELGIYASCRDDFDSTPIHAAAQFGTLEVTKYLVEEERCDVMIKNKSGGDALCVAALGGKLDIVQYLIQERKCDPMTRGIYGRHPIHFACGYGHLNVVKYFADELNVDPSCKDAQNSTPLHLAAQFGTLELVKYLIEDKKCDVMCRGQYGRTPLHYACLNKDATIAIYLVDEQDVDPSCRDADDSTPLHISAQQEIIEIVRYLVEEKGCSLTCNDKYKKTPLEAAAVNGKVTSVRYLISKGGDPYYKGDNGRVSLHWACQSGSVEVVRYLIEEVGMDPLCRDNDDVTTLHTAALCGQVGVVKLLVEEFHCDPLTKDKWGNIPVNVANQYGKTQVVSYLSSLKQSTSSDMRSALMLRLKAYTINARPTGVELGSGTYGSVIELIHCGEKVAGKKFKISSLDRMQAMTEKLCGEMILMMQVRHKNIVESKGVCFLSGHPMPVLLMERMVCSLHAYLLDPANTNLKISRKFSLLNGVASGLAYLHNHKPVVIHRDLTARNVLLDSELNAKICDFGNSRVMDLDPDTSPETFTSVPGTLDFMPPEALGAHAEYDTSIDIFSFGHLAIFTLTQSTVNVLPPTYSDGIKLHPRSEVKRRSESLSLVEKMLGTEHKILHVVKLCLHNRPAQRPRTVELVQTLQTMNNEDQQGEIFAGNTNIFSTAPRLSQLKCMTTSNGKKVKIIESVAVHWRDFGALLDFDPMGNRLEIIAVTERERPEECCQSMFQHWLNGNGVPATWSTLIRILQNCRLGVLAAEVKEALKTKEGS
jgi:ankyrin repeat protein